MSTPGATAATRPHVEVDPSAFSRDRAQPSPHSESPQSAIIEVPPGWNGSPASTSRGSMDVARRSIDTDASARGSMLVSVYARSEILRAHLI